MILHRRCPLASLARGWRWGGGGGGCTATKPKGVCIYPKGSSSTGSRSCSRVQNTRPIRHDGASSRSDWHKGPWTDLDRPLEALGDAGSSFHAGTRARAREMGSSQLPDGSGTWPMRCRRPLPRSHALPLAPTCSLSGSGGSASRMCSFFAHFYAPRGGCATPVFFFS